MILEIAQLQVKPGQGAEFQTAFNLAHHELQRCIERTEHYMLLVRWESIEHHEEGFRKSAEYQEWRKLLHHFYDPFPTVLHYEQVAGVVPNMRFNPDGFTAG